MLELVEKKELKSGDYDGGRRMYMRLAVQRGLLSTDGKWILTDKEGRKISPDGEFGYDRLKPDSDFGPSPYQLKFTSREAAENYLKVIGLPGRFGIQLWHLEEVFA